MTEQYRQDLFLLQPIISKFYFSSLKNGSQSLGTLTDECEQYKGLHYQFKNQIIMHFVS